MRVSLHIGVEKTGTTTLQRFLYENSHALRRQGIAFTQSCGPENNRDLATYAIDDAYFEEDYLIELGILDLPAKRKFKEAVAARFSAEVETLRDSCDAVVISSEHLQSRLKSVAEVRCLQELLLSTGLVVDKVIVYLRRPVDIINSMYSTALRSGSTAAPPRTLDEHHWIHICDHRNTLQTWSEVFGEAALVPRLFEPSFLAGGSVIDDFCVVTGIAMKGLRIPPNQNRSLSVGGQILLRYLNDHLPIAPGISPPHRRLQIIAFIDEHFSGPAPAPTPELVASCEARFAESNEWVRQRYFPDRNELFPARSALGQDAQDEPNVEELLEFLADHWQQERSFIDQLRSGVPLRFPYAP